MYLPVSQRYCLARLLPSQGKHRTKVGNAVYSQEHTQESRSNQHSTAYTSTHTHKYTPRQGLPPDCSPSRHRLSDDYKSPADDSSDRPQHSLAAGKGTKKRGQHQRVWICRGTAEMNRSLLPKKWIRQWRKQFLKILFFFKFEGKLLTFPFFGKFLWPSTWHGSVDRIREAASWADNRQRGHLHNLRVRTV